MTDLSSFNVKKISGNHGNLKIVDVVPSATSLSVIVALDGSPQVVTNDSALQVLYPAGSINPANEDRPQGGVQFYAEPLDIKQARKRYDFDFVLAGKLPGLYGGHGGCSGGVSATDCFSTRMMWRKDGEGELYLYAPKDKQTDALCNDPRSTCDVAYGFSIGRGSFVWARGGWTTVSQTVVLNTPGRTDGCFTLDVNGIRVIDRSDVFYRDVAGQPKTTFFGGHEDKYATPKDQYAWFKDFAMCLND
ncbi:hypothetical protein EDD18DRAFT_1310997 [Armillaria luteobubalina]|uniref:Polysaccharide lyase 14 domain-containing protein n=1 Tax=Armillaria luteobubalina TaxID=153913 RepID=A0AA39PYR7_9AGAR|nr:hypothetical protein EDD18DRAFT_1310997 [Armillaria luteobubalina]